MNIDPRSSSSGSVIQRAWCAAACVLLLATSASALTIAPEKPATQPATQPAAPAVKLDPALRANLAWQIALDRAGFSPGLIDGKIGPKTRIATNYFQLTNQLPITAKLDAATAEALGPLLPAPDAVLEVHSVTESDVASVTGVTKDWIERSKMKSLGYDTLADALAERYQTTQAMLQLLNPRIDLDKLEPGARVNVPATSMAKRPLKQAACLEVNLTRKFVRAIDEQDSTLALAHCSIAANAEKRPSGDASVTSVAFDPNYTFNPELYPEVKNVATKLIIPPGPRNPVGIAWIGLSLPGYGIHGTPWPELIGKTGSHGCIRLANWDARRIAKLVRVGTAVRFVEEKTAP